MATFQTLLGEMTAMFSLPLFALLCVCGVASVAPSLSNISYAVLGPFPAGTREVADPTEAFGGIDVLYSRFAAGGPGELLPSELADGGNVTWTNATADVSGLVQMPFPSVRFDNLNAAFGPFLLGVQGWAVGTWAWPAAAAQLD